MLEDGRSAMESTRTEFSEGTTMPRGHWILLTLIMFSLPRVGIADTVYILDSPEDALIGRVHILDAARDSIDIMYFSIHDDAVTAAALGMVREKALAGIRVRMITAAGGFDVDPAMIYHFGSLDNFEIRIYNKPTAAKPFRALRKLHDKLMLVDGEHYITGGRNLGEVYFDLAGKKNKVDRDIYIRGSTARTAQAYFDELWNSTEVTPIPHKPYTLENMSPDYCEDPERAGKRCVRIFEKRHAAVQAEVDKLEEAFARVKAHPDYQEAIADQTPYLRDIPDDQIIFIHDAVGGEENREVNDVLAQLAAKADGEILVQSPYVIPDKSLYELFEQKKAEGVPVTFVTNSSKSTVNVVAQAGYQRYRKRMLDAGAVFIESTGTYMLHAKSLVTRSKDGSCIGGIGSFNIDPRSGYLNTETYVVIRNCEFADELEGYIRSYAVDGIVLTSREDLKKLKPMKKEVPFGKRFLISIFKFFTPLYRSQL